MVRATPSRNHSSGILKLLHGQGILLLWLNNNQLLGFGFEFMVYSKNIGDLGFFFAIASSIGTLICMDEETNRSMFERSYGHFYRILVELDLTSRIRDNILVERSNFSFFVNVVYENMPDFSDHCKIIGYNVGNCRRINGNQNQNKQDVKTVFITKVINYDTLIVSVSSTPTKRGFNSSLVKGKDSESNVKYPALTQVENQVENSQENVIKKTLQILESDSSEYDSIDATQHQIVEEETFMNRVFGDVRSFNN